MSILASIFLIQRNELEKMNGIRIVGMSIVFCIAYGVLHDQITARICVEYFTIGHPTIIRSKDPTQLGIVWGVVATWWVGVLLGIPLAFAARLGPAPKRSPRQLMRPMLVLMLFCGTCAILFGCVCFVLASNGWVVLVGDLKDRIPLDRHTYFITDLWAHGASYFFGFTGGIFLSVSTWRSRKVLTVPNS